MVSPPNGTDCGSKRVKLACFLLCVFAFAHGQFLSEVWSPPSEEIASETLLLSVYVPPFIHQKHTVIASVGGSGFIKSDVRT